MVKFFPILVILFIIVVLYSGLNLIGQESVGNSNLDNQSLALIIQMNSDIERDFGTLDNTENVSVNTTGNEGQDPFALQFLENKQQKSKLEQYTNMVISIPDLMVSPFAESISRAERDVYVLLLTAFLVIVLFIAGFVAIFGEGRLT